MEDKRERKVIQLSFKNDGAEAILYDYLKKRLSPAPFIKEILWLFYLDQTYLIKHDSKLPTDFGDIMYTMPQTKKVETGASFELNEDAERDEILF